MLRFPFQDLRPFEGRSAPVKRPRQVTLFSFDDKHQCFPLDSRSLRYYYPPLFDVPSSLQDPKINLSDGFDTFIKHDDSVDLHLDALLETLEAHEKKAGDKVEADIVTWRGMMTKFLAAPYDMFGEFEMNATYFDVRTHPGNNVSTPPDQLLKMANQLTAARYIEENKTTKSIDSRPPPARNRAQPIPQEEMQYWGYKFETLSTLPKPWAECDREDIQNREMEIVDNHAQYCSIVRTGIGQHSLVIGGEVDAIQGSLPDDPDDSIPYVELKTSENFHPNDEQTYRKFERKMCRFWAQSFLLGVPKIIIGFRSKTGILERLEEWNTLDIPNFVKRRGLQTWDGNVCINFASAFLDFLKEHISSEGTWTLERRKGSKEICLSKVSDDYDERIVTNRFREHRAELTASS